MVIQSILNYSSLDEAGKFTLATYHRPTHFPILAEVTGRVAALALLSLAAASDIALHSFFVLPTLIYAVGRSVYLRKADFTLPWQQIQRVRNSVAPFLLASVLGVFHPYAGIAIGEPTDKHIMLGMLVSRIDIAIDTPCSPIHSLSIVEELAIRHQFQEDEKGKTVALFSSEHIQAIRSARKYERELEKLQAQEFIYKLTNLTLFVMWRIIASIHASHLNETQKALAERVSGVLIPVLTAVDMAIALVIQTLFLATGFIRLISGRGPLYTEVTIDPLMHVGFFIQNILKAVGNLLGTLIWLAVPPLGFKASLLASNRFFNMQMSFLWRQLRDQLSFAKEGSRFALPIVFGEGTCSALTLPIHNSHKTYLIVEKKSGLFNLFWVNRPDITLQSGWDLSGAQAQIWHMFNERFPFMDMAKMLAYPVVGKKPDFPGSTQYATITAQGGSTNCVVSNLFGMFEALDRIQGVDPEVTRLRYRVIRTELKKTYAFYQNSLSPSASNEGYSLSALWNRIAGSTDESI